MESGKNLGMTMLVLLVGWFGCTAIQGDMDAGGWHAIGGFRARTCQRKGAYR